MRESEWREVRRRGSGPKTFHGSSEDDSITSFFVADLPGDVTKAEIWKLCSPLGKLVDVYIAGRRDASGTFFGFVRFTKLGNPEETEKGLNNVICRGER